MVWLGLISYSIYLVHVPVLVLLPTLGAYPIQGSDAPGSLTRVIALAVPATIATSAAFYYLIERPFQASGKRGSRQPVHAAWWARNQSGHRAECVGRAAGPVSRGRELGA